MSDLMIVRPESVNGESKFVSVFCLHDFYVWFIYTYFFWGSDTFLGMTLVIPQSMVVTFRVPLFGFGEVWNNVPLSKRLTQSFSRGRGTYNS